MNDCLTLSRSCLYLPISIFSFEFALLCSLLPFSYSILSVLPLIFLLLWTCLSKYWRFIEEVDLLRWIVLRKWLEPLVIGLNFEPDAQWVPFSKKKSTLYVNLFHFTARWGQKESKVPHILRTELLNAVMSDSRLVKKFHQVRRKRIFLSPRILKAVSLYQHWWGWVLCLDSSAVVWDGGYLGIPRRSEVDVRQVRVVVVEGWVSWEWANGRVSELHYFSFNGWNQIIYYNSQLFFYWFMSFLKLNIHHKHIKIINEGL